MSEFIEETEADEEELFEHYRFKADPGQEVIRIDKFLIDRMPNTSRNKVQIAAKSGNILVNDQKVKQNYRVKPGDSVSILMPYPVREIELIPEDITLNINGLAVEISSLGSIAKFNMPFFTVNSFL